MVLNETYISVVVKKKMCKWYKISNKKEQTTYHQQNTSKYSSNNKTTINPFIHVYYAVYFDQYLYPLNKSEKNKQNGISIDSLS